MTPSAFKSKSANSTNRLLAAAFIAALFTVNVYSQTTGGVNNTGGVSIVQGINPPHESAMLDITSTNKGVLIPRLTTAQRIAINPKTEGLMVYDVTRQMFYYVDNSLCWRELESHNVSDSAKAAPSGDACNRASGKVPVGGIIMFSGDMSVFTNNGGMGAVHSEYEGWAVCDGTNGTPDLRNRFIVSTGSKYTLGNSGGYDDIALTEAQMPAHKHEVNTSALTVYMAPHSHSATADPHSHTFPTDNGTSGGYADKGGNDNNGNYSTNPATVIVKIGNAGGGNATITVDQSNFIQPKGGGTSFDNRPAFYALAYIMRIK